jgi:hypothetical protein
VLFPNLLQIILFKTVRNDRSWLLEERAAVARITELMVNDQNTKLGCKVCREVGTVSTHKMYRSLSCPGNNKTAMYKVSATVTKKRGKRLQKQNMDTKYCCITVMSHNTCQITGRKVTEIKYGNTFKSGVTGIPEQADKGDSTTSSSGTSWATGLP